MKGACPQLAVCSCHVKILKGKWNWCLVGACIISYCLWCGVGANLEGKAKSWAPLLVIWVKIAREPFIACRVSNF